MEQFQLVIAGRLITKIESFLTLTNIPGVTLKLNVDSDELIKLYQTSRIFFNYSMNPSGVKLKLYEAFSFGLPTLSNRNGYFGSGLDTAVIDIDAFNSDEFGS